MGKFIKSLLGVLVLGAVAAALLYFFDLTQPSEVMEVLEEEEGAGQESEPQAFSIETLIDAQYPGSDLFLEQTLSDGPNYTRSVVSYASEGLKIYALLTVPKVDKPAGGFPAIVMNHGSVPPDEYSTPERYKGYVAYFARRGYVVLKPDYRGHGHSEGVPLSSYYDPGYVTDVLNAVSSLQRHPDVNAEKIGMWGHSSGGHITTVAMIVNPKIKAGVIWAGLTASYDETFVEWRAHRRRLGSSSSSTASPYRRQSQVLEEKYGSISQATEFWRGVTPFNYFSRILHPLQLHHGTADNIVPLKYAEYFLGKLLAAGRVAELFTYPGADHNLSGSAFAPAMARSVEFFDQHLK